MGHNLLNATVRRKSLTDVLLLCGIASGLVYIAADASAALVYPGYSFEDHAVSELFAIGAPTTYLMVPLLNLSSALLLAFSAGIARRSSQDRPLRLVAAMFAGSAVVALLLWNVFPMHMRGAERTFTDAVHLMLATNPFVLGTLVIAFLAFRNWFRWTSLAVLGTDLVLASYGFSMTAALDAGEQTPGLGLSERLAQYLYLAWQATLALALLARKEGRMFAQACRSEEASNA